MLFPFLQPLTVFYLPFVPNPHCRIPWFLAVLRLCGGQVSPAVGQCGVALQALILLNLLTMLTNLLTN